MRTGIYNVFGILLICLTLAGCERERPGCDEERFCELTEEKKFEELRPLINNYLSTLDYGPDAEAKEEENIQKLEEWLECKSCIGRVKIECVSCIMTLPAQSELVIHFKAGGKTIKKVMDVRMAVPMTVRFH
jgi:hypothetical protein